MKTTCSRRQTCNWLAGFFSHPTNYAVALSIIYATGVPTKDCEDVLSDFVTACIDRRWKVLRRVPEADRRKYVFRALRYEAISHYRRKKRCLEDQLPVNDAGTPSDEVFSRVRSLTPEDILLSPVCDGVADEFIVRVIRGSKYMRYLFRHPFVLRLLYASDRVDLVRRFVWKVTPRRAGEPSWREVSEYLMARTGCSRAALDKAMHDLRPRWLMFGREILDRA